MIPEIARYSGGGWSQLVVLLVLVLVLALVLVHMYNASTRTLQSYSRLQCIYLYLKFKQYQQQYQYQQQQQYYYYYLYQQQSQQQEQQQQYQQQSQLHQQQQYQQQYRYSTSSIIKIQILEPFFDDDVTDKMYLPLHLQMKAIVSQHLVVETDSRNHDVDQGGSHDICLAVQAANICRRGVPAARLSVQPGLLCPGN